MSTSDHRMNGASAFPVPRPTATQKKHIQRLVSWWTLLADLSFSDLLLFTKVSEDGVPTAGGGGGATPAPPPSPTETGSIPVPTDRFVVVDQVRASTGRTLYVDDHVGALATPQERPFVAEAFRQGRIQTGEVRLSRTNKLAHVTCIPVPSGGRVVAVLSSEVTPEFVTNPDFGNLERNYLMAFAALSNMVAGGDFPYPAPALPLRSDGLSLDPTHDELPRVGDGLLLTDQANVVIFASPNAVSALHRVGFSGDIEGKRLDQIGLAEEELSLPRPRSVPVTTELETETAVVQVTALPLTSTPREFPFEKQERLDAVVLVRDVTALRQRDRLIRSKDRTIAEIHHRVKNNLQTISSLLRIQTRRLSSDEATEALQESIRRISAIALVHEALSTEAGDDVDFCGVAYVLADTMEHAITSEDRPFDFVVRCAVGKVPSEIVTPLAVVLTELLQNAVDHAYPEEWLTLAGRRGGVGGASGGGGGSVGTVEVNIDQPDETTLRMTVSDDGIGLPDDFDIEKTQGLGTLIVRALTTADLGGTLVYRRRANGPGSVVLVEVPLRVSSDVGEPGEPGEVGEGAPSAPGASEAAS